MDNPTTNTQKKPEQGAARLATWLVNYEVPLFFVLTFAFTWTIYACISRLQLVDRWTLIAAFGPSVVAMLLARITDSQLARPRVIQQATLFVLAFAVAFGIEWLDHKWWYHRINTPLIVADVVLCFLVALVICGVLSSRRGVRNLLQGLIRWRVGAGWYILAFGLWPVMVLAANAVASIFGLEVPIPPYHSTRIPLIPLIIESFFWFLLFGGPLNEEAGWRAFALTKLQRRFSPFIASVIVGSMWGLWHVPLHLMGYYPMGSLGAIIRVFDIPRAIVFTWLFNRTRQSLLPILILHAATNTTSLFIARNYVTSSALLTLLAVILVFVDKMWRSPAEIENAGRAT